MEGWSRFFAGAGAVLAFFSVALGAFAAHGLRTRLEPRALEVFETAVRYQFFHALALLLLALLLDRVSGAAGVAAGWAFLVGILVFSGSLYLLALTGVGRWGAVTPLGGLAFLAGWLLLLWHVVRT